MWSRTFGKVLQMNMYLIMTSEMSQVFETFRGFLLS